tara:strand:+ start:1388 stop:1591 length:204 start_codon:yes stop_codon:yes gene_type:complete
MRKVFNQMSNNITASSTKAQIIESAEELISDLDSKLTREITQSSNLKEEKFTLVCLVVLLFSYSVLF